MELSEPTGLSNDNLKRLFQIEMIDHLDLRTPSANDEIALLSVSAQANSLSYSGIRSSLLEKVDFSSLEIVATKLAITILHESENSIFPTDLMLSFWRRVADLGHFVELQVVVYCGDDFLVLYIYPVVLFKKLSARHLQTAI